MNEGRIRMKAETNITLEQQLATLAAELAHTRSELRALQRQLRRGTLASSLAYSGGLAVLALVIGSALTPTGIAQQEISKPTKILEAPVEVRGKSGQTIAVFSEEPGHYGLTVVGKSGGAVGIGSSSGKGLLLLQDTGRNTFASIDGEGFKFVEGGHNVVFVGKAAAGAEITVNGLDGNPIASLVRTTNGGKLELSNTGGQLMVEAGTTDSGVGVVRTGPMSRVPGGLMGVPGSYISGKK